MTKKHSSIKKFKQFVKNHPKLIDEVRKENKTWQELYEEWFLLGETDEIWEQYATGHEERFESKDEESEEKKESETKQPKKDFFTQIISAVKKMDANQVNDQIYKMSSTIETIQHLFDEFSSKKKEQSQTGSNHPFSFRKD